MTDDDVILLISCPDQKGITAAVADFIYRHNGNILHADQHIDDQSNTFFMRVAWSLTGFSVERNRISQTFRPLAEKFAMAWEIYFSDERMRTAVFVSQHLHCLYDLLYRYRSEQLKCEIALIFSNHPDGQDLAREYGIPYVHLPMTAENKNQQELKQLEILKQNNIDLLILARYHQILTPAFVAHYPHKIINIHHSFLPAFAGKNPYAQAYRKGVKIIGATSHYVIDALDEGPIIEQDTVRISHRDSLDDLKRKGEDLERMVLSRAVRTHLERKVLCYNNKTVVFD